MSDHDGHRGSSVAAYTAIALILGVITFVEFAVIQWRLDWISTGWLVFSLVVMSVGKFWLVVAFFMHLKDDENAYSGFFTTGMVFALGTFVALGFLFTVGSVSSVWAKANAPQEIASEAGGHGAEAGHGAEGGGGHGIPKGIPEATLANIESDGYSRSLTVLLDTPRPKDHEAIQISFPLPETGDFQLQVASLFGGAGAPDTVEEATTADRAFAQGEPGLSFDTELGLETFNTTCVACHQSTGQGIPGAFPPLVEHAANLYNVEGGRDYLISAVLYGLQGPVEIAGTTYNSVMAPWSSLSDEQVAAVLNYVVTSWGNRELLTEFTPISPDEVAALRGQGLSGAQALELRPSLEAGTDPESGAEFDTELGLETFNTTCVACHQSTGQGIPGAFPPLVEHAANLYNVEGGRDYLISAVLYGLQGPVEIAGTTYNSVMAPWSSLSDEQVAAVLNYVVTSWGNRELLTEFTPISPDEVAALRGQGLSGAQALELRPSLEVP